MENSHNFIKSNYSRSLVIITIFLSVGLSTLFTNCSSPPSNSDSSSSITPEISEDIVVSNSTPVVYDTNYNYFGSNASSVPKDIIDCTQVALAQFAWREFIALNWPSNYPSKQLRGEASDTATVAGFLRPDPNHPLVWQTFKHRVEFYPENTLQYDTNFNSPPKYLYSIENQSSIKRLGDSTAPVLASVNNIFNNLDETTQINLCTIFFDGDPLAPGADTSAKPIASGLPGAPRRLLFEAKGNKDMFKYVVKNQLYNDSIRNARIVHTKNAIKANGTGAVYPCPPDSNQICFPFGGHNEQQGNILVKATWKQLTLKEYKSGRYLTAPVIYYRKGTKTDPSDTKVYYDIIPATPTPTSLPYGLAGLHIIHKTVHYPSYIFATFEQVDNLDTTLDNNYLFYYNRNSNPFVNPGKQYAYRYANILASTTQINDSVHSQIKKLDSSSVWQYYKLIGVQGHPQINDDSTDYFLANIVTETNQVLRDFSGTLDSSNGTIDPTGINIFQGNRKIVQGGCKGCHGNAQKSDFSFITRDAPIKEPDVINEALLK